MRVRKELRELREHYRALADRHDDLLALTVARLDDLESSLAALYDGLPRFGFTQTKSQIAETRRRIETISQALREELDFYSDERPLLVSQTGTVRAVLGTFAFASLMNLGIGEINDEVNLRVLAETVVERWQAADESSAEALEVGQQAVEVSIALDAAEDRRENLLPPMSEALGHLMTEAESALLRVADTMRRVAESPRDVLIPSGEVEARARDIAGMRGNANAEGVAPTTSSIGSLLRQLRSMRRASDAGPLAGDFAKAEAALSRVMRNIEESRRQLVSESD